MKTPVDLTLETLTDDVLLRQLKSLVGRSNQLTAELLAHLGEVDARGIYRHSACSSTYAYCIFELRMSEDAAQRRIRAARIARQFPIVLKMIEQAALHLSGLLLLGPHLTEQNDAELLARARYRTKREIEKLVAQVAPQPDVPTLIKPLGPAELRPAPARATHAAYTVALAGPVRELVPDNGPGRQSRVNQQAHPRRRRAGGGRA